MRFSAYSSRMWLERRLSSVESATMFDPGELLFFEKLNLLILKTVIHFCLQNFCSLFVETLEIPMAFKRNRNGFQ